MEQILNDVITDENLAWDNKLEKKAEKFSVVLTDETINEFLDNRTNLLENL